MTTTTAPALALPRPPKGAAVLAARYARALRTPKGIIGALLVIAFLLIASTVTVLFPDGYDVQSRDGLAGPAWAAPFGTDEVGRSVFVRSLFGIRTDLLLIAAAIPVAALLGTLLGLIGAVSPFLGGLAQRVFDLIMGFPSLILGICVALVLGPGWGALVVAMVIYALPAFGRLARVTLLAQEGRDYVVAARLLGVSRGRVMLRHILPHTLDTMIAQAVVAVVASIVLESSLSIVGLGVQPPDPSLGVLLNSGTRHLEQQPGYVLGPALLLFLLVLGFSLAGDAIGRAGGES